MFGVLLLVNRLNACVRHGVRIRTLTRGELLGAGFTLNRRGFWGDKVFGGDLPEIEQSDARESRCSGETFRLLDDGRKVLLKPLEWFAAISSPYPRQRLARPFEITAAISIFIFGPTICAQ